MRNVCFSSSPLLLVFLVPCNENNYYVTLHSIINIYNGDDYCVAQNYNLSTTKDLTRVSLDFHQPLRASFTRSEFSQTLFVNHRGTFSLQMLIYFFQVRQAVCMTMWKYLTARGQTPQAWVDSVGTSNPPLCVLQLMF